MSACLLSERALVEARMPEDLASVRRLFRAYADWLGVSLCFQGFERELAELPGAYALAPGVCEMKRLWVEPGFGGQGIGRALAESIVAAARAIGYQRMRLDTIPARMPAAQHLYASLGFRQIPPYYHNPLEGVVMLELAL